MARERAGIEILVKSDRDPIPFGVRIGDLVFSSTLVGADLESGELGQGLRGQLELALQNMRTLVERNGGAMDNVARVTMFVDDLSDREAIDAPWVAMFPGAGNRPARKVLRAPLPAGVRVQIEALALLGEQRKRLDILGVPARDPTVKIGNLVCSSRLHGTAGSGDRGEGPEAQAEVAFQHVRALLEMSGGDLTDVTQVTVFLTIETRCRSPSRSPIWPSRRASWGRTQRRGPCRKAQINRPGGPCGTSES